MLELTGEHIARLGDEDLRLLVTKLCEAELRRNGLPSSSVLDGGNQTAKDGGIDVRIQLAPTTAALDFIPRPDTGFQVKCEDMPAGEITKEMRPKGELREDIKDLISCGGAYVIVSSKGSVTDSSLGRRREAMRNAIADQPDAAKLLVDFYDRNRLARWAREYPGVEMWVREQINARLQGWQGYTAWSGDRPGKYLYDDTARLVERTDGGPPTALPATEGLDRLRKVMKQPGHVARIVGLSGTGKTRLVQALFEPGTGSEAPLDPALVLYTDLGDSPEPNAREMLLRLGTSRQRAIVVVDNCNPATHKVLAQVVLQYPTHLSLLTVEYDVADEDVPEATNVYELAPASSHVLSKILEHLAPHLTEPDRYRITEIAGGNARIALALARTVARGETLGTLTDPELFRRLFRQKQTHDEELLRAAEVCSLVYSFDGTDTKSDLSELQVLANLAGMSVNELYRHVSTLRNRDLVQSRGKWRALLPPALANRLAESALQNIPSSDITNAFALHERLLVSFSRRLEYLHSSNEARSIGNRWMEDEQWLAKPATLNALGRKLFINLAPLSPQKTLESLERALGPGTSSDFLLRQNGSLQEWGTLLRHLAYEPQAFDRAAPLLLILAEHEDGRTIDLRRAWKEIFRIGLSGTMAPPEQRVRLLNRLLTSTSGKRRELVWDAVEAMLEFGPIDSSHEFSFGARPHGYGWEPSSVDEVKAWLEGAFTLIRSIAASGAEGLERARTAITAHFRELWRREIYPQLSAMTLELAQEDGWPAGWIAVRSALHFDGDTMEPGMLSALRNLETALTPTGLLQEIRTYALNHTRDFLNVTDALDESNKAEDENPVDAWHRADNKVIALGEAAAHDEAVLLKIIPELLAAVNGRQYLFGRGLGIGSPNPRHQWELLYDAFTAATDTPNVAVLAGFVQGLRTKDYSAAVQILDSVAGDPRLDPYYPIILGVPQDDEDGDRLIAAMKRQVANPCHFALRIRHSEAFGFSLQKFCEASEVLSRMPDGLVASIDELDTELRRWKIAGAPQPMELVQLGRSLLSRFDSDFRDHGVAWRVNELAKIALAGPDAKEAAAQLASRLAAAMEDYSRPGGEFGDLACTLFKLQPAIALDAFLSKSSKRHNFGLRSRFTARHSPVLQCAPEDAILSWVQVDPASRAPLVAAEINIIVSQGTNGIQLSPLAHQLLELASDKRSILEAFNKSLHPWQWSGSLSQALEPFILLLEGLAAHSDATIANWANKNLEHIQKRIESDRAIDRLSEESFE